MKKSIQLLTFVLLGFFLFSCENNMVDETKTEIRSDLRSTGINGVYLDVNNQLLYFESDSIFLLTVDVLSQMNDSEYENFVSQLNYTSSLQSLYEKAEKELNIMTELADSTLFIEKYNQFQSEYSSYFIFDNSTTEDRNLSPQLKVENPVIASLVNSQGKVTIGGKLINMNKYENYNDVVEDFSLKSTTNENFIEMKTSSRKLRVYLSKNTSNQLVIKFSCQAKVWYGWKNNNSTYAVRLSLTNCTPYYTNRPNDPNWPAAITSYSYQTSSATSSWSGSFAQLSSAIQDRGYISVTSSAFNNTQWGLIKVRL